MSSAILSHMSMKNCSLPSVNVQRDRKKNTWGTSDQLLPSLQKDSDFYFMGTNVKLTM